VRTKSQIHLLLGAAILLLPALLSGCCKRPSAISSLPLAADGRTFESAAQGLPPVARFYRGSTGGPRLMQALPGGSDEIWVLARGRQSAAASDDHIPGTGSLIASIEGKQVPMPLKHTDVRASISGSIGAVKVAQQFHNPYSSKIEAVYVFPLPHNAAVNEFIMTIGERRIRGIVRERTEAEAIYKEARRQGYVASLLTEERPNVFTQSVANIEPGKEIEIHIHYFHTLEYADGWYEFVFPMVVGPRFNPPGMREGVGAVARGKHGLSGQKTEVPYLKPDERASHDISLSVEIDAGVKIEEFQCQTHQVTHERLDAAKLVVSLTPTDSVPNRDFVFRYRVGAAGVKSSLLTHRDQRGGYFTLMLYPPQELASLKRQPLELVFVLDCSGSMSGRPIAAAKSAAKRALELLEPKDSFQVINFSVSASQLGPQPLEATEENVQRGVAYLESLRGEGGTMMVEGIKAALDFPHDPRRLRFVCFLTDGYIGNEAEILREIHDRLGASRIFSFGIGSSVNRYLMDQMAKTGRGAVAYLGPREDAAQIMEAFFERISHPALTDLTIQWDRMRVSEVFPGVAPDLFVGRPVILTGRFSGEATPIRITGTASGQPITIQIPEQATHTANAPSALPSVWARMKIADLAAQTTYNPDGDLPAQIREVAIDYGLLSAFTAFVAVDSTRVTDGDKGTTVPVAVPVPEGVNYDTTVSEK
jgi:Ca-activated chloride channel homolog